MITRSMLLVVTLAGLSVWTPAFGQSSGWPSEGPVPRLDVFAGGSHSDTDDKKDSHRAVGVWLWTNTPASPGLAPGNSLIVFHKGGLTTSTNAEPTAQGADGSRQSTQYGTWERVSETELEATWYSLFVSPTNVPVATIRVQSRIRLDGQSRMTARTHIEVRPLPDGPVVFTGDATNVGQRLVHVPLAQ